MKLKGSTRVLLGKGRGKNLDMFLHFMFKGKSLTDFINFVSPNN